MRFIRMNVQPWAGYICTFAQRLHKSCLHLHKKPESFVHSGFLWEVARQLPLNTAKKPVSKKPTSRVGFFETPPVFQGFFANVNACSNLAGIIRVFDHVVRDLLRNHPTAAHDVMRTTYGQR